jgi:Na+/H+ antiporter NhaC
MNWQKFFIAFIAAFIFLFVFGFLWYGTLMQSAHQEVAALWRPKPDYPWLIMGHVVMALFLTLLYARYVAVRGIVAGAILGICVALVYAGTNMITFAVQPLTTKILSGWIAGDLIQFAIAGAIIGAVYKDGSR